MVSLMSNKTIIYKAKNIITMNGDLSQAKYIAIRGDKIVGIGNDELLQQASDYVLDMTFQNKYFLPGFIEGHSHATEGCMWEHPYIGYFDRVAPDRSLWVGLKGKSAIIELLSYELEKRKSDSLIAWGYDPVFFDEKEQLTRHDLDKIATDKPVLIIHASFHILVANTFLLEQSGLAEKLDLTGVVKNQNGEPTGELQGLIPRGMALSYLGWDRDVEMTKESSLWNFANSARRVGVTTVTDLANNVPDAVIPRLNKLTANKEFPLRLVVALLGNSLSPQKACERLNHLKAKNTDKLRFGILKLVLDGSIQGFTARLLSSEYYNGNKNGLWYMDPTSLAGSFKYYKDNQVSVHMHVNGDEAADTAIKAIDEAFDGESHLNLRWTLQHFQLAHEKHYAKISELGVCANLFANHIFYWGDIHRRFTVGPKQASSMNCAAWAKKYNVPYSIHSDAPITPLNPLFTASCVVNRLTSSGYLLGQEHRISVQDALYAITMGAAFTLGMEKEVGSLEVGKFADLAILDQDPFAVSSTNLHTIPIWGTMVGGEVFAN